MKKALFYIIGICLALAACTDETLTQEQEATQQTFNVAIGETGDARQTKAAVTMPRYMLEMYEGDLSATPERMGNATGTFSVTMKKGVDYLCLFWADNGAEAYDASSLQAVKLKDETQPGTAAYCAKVTVNSRSFNGNITLRRAVAELSFIDQYGLNQAKNTLKITYPYASAVMNLGDGTVTYTTGETPAVRTFAGITPPAESTDAFAQDFILAPVVEGILNGLKFQLNSQEEKSIPETAVQANYQTKITGEYDTSLPSMSFTIDTRNGGSNDATFILPLSATLSGYTLSVDWGDGETSEFTDGTTLNQDNMTHTYDQAGTYTIVISTTQKDRTKAQMPKLSFGENYWSVNSNKNKLVSLNTPLLNMGTNLYRCFFNCSGLTEISKGLFDNNPNVTSFSLCFMYCEGLTQIPEGLFDNNTAVTDFSYCFNECHSLTQIPKGLFNNNTAVTSFNYCFAFCSTLTEIPEGLFDNNPNVEDFSICFESCSSLTEIPAGLFKNNKAVTNFINCFGHCSTLIKIPEGLFDNNKDVTSFNSCFNGCGRLTQIPEGLFDNNKSVTSFSGCFSDCSGLTQIPEGLFGNNKDVTSFSSCFYGCTSLTQIPEGLFDNNPNVTSFSYCFKNCHNLKPIANLFCNEANEEEKKARFAGKKINFNYCFQNCGSNTDGSGTLPALWTYTMEPSSTHSGCFTGANATNINDVQAGWK